MIQQHQLITHIVPDSRRVWTHGMENAIVIKLMIQKLKSQVMALQEKPVLAMLAAWSLFTKK